MSLLSEEKHHYVAVMPHTLHAVRTAGQTVEFGGECALLERHRVQKLLQAWSEGRAVSGVVAIAPEPAWWYLGDSTGTRTFQTEAEIRRFAAGLPHRLRPPLAMMACNAADGKGVSVDSDAPWLLGVTQSDALAGAAAEASERGIVTAALGSATLDCVGAAVTAVQLDGAGVVRLWAIGHRESCVFTVSVRGVEAIARCATGFDSVFAAVQQVFGLQTATDAANLFFEQPADPAAAAHLAAIIAPQLQSVLSATIGGDVTGSFACTGLTGRETWFGHAIAQAMGLPYWQPNVNRYLDHLQLKLAPVPEDQKSLSLLGTLHLAAGHARRSAAWHPSWGFISFTAPSNDIRRPHHVAVAPATTAAVPFAAAAAHSEVATESPADVLPAPPKETPVPSRAPASPANVPVARRETHSQSDEPAAAPVPSPSESSLERRLPSPQLTSEISPISRSTETSRANHRPTLASNGDWMPPRPPWSPEEEVMPHAEPTVIVLRRTGYWPVVGIVLALLGAGLAGKFYVDAEEVKAAAAKEKRAAAQAQEKAEREVSAAVEQVRLASQQAASADLRARELAAANSRAAERARTDTEAVRREAMEQARREAEEQTVRILARELAAARAAVAPGTLKITSVPPGANVHVDGRPAQRAPVSIEGLSPGRHAVKLTLADHVPQELTADIVAAMTTDLGSIKLEPAIGTLVVSSSPAESEFSIRASSTPADAAPLRRGRTPAQLDGLPAGEYVVQFSRAGWPDRNERVTIEGGATARVATEFHAGTVTINSSPTGATVLQGGLLLGKAPLTLSDVPPQKVTYELIAPGYEPLKVSGTVAEGRALELNGTLMDLNRVVSAEEVRTPPRPYQTTPLGLGRVPRSAPPFITVSFVVLPNGSLEDVTVVGTVDRKIARKSVEAIAKWKFFPGVSHAGYPVKVRMSMPIRVAGG